MGQWFPPSCRLSHIFPLFLTFHLILGVAGSLPKIFLMPSFCPSQSIQLSLHFHQPPEEAHSGQTLNFCVSPGAVHALPLATMPSFFSPVWRRRHVIQMLYSTFFPDAHPQGLVTPPSSASGITSTLS